MADYRNQVEFIKQWEGGLSNDPRDTSAAAYPAPCYYNGQTGWHTNKGITYRTFESNAAKLGYVPTCENFFSMPDRIWLKVYKVSFWDKFSLDGYRSQAIADVIVSLAWLSGIFGAYKQLAKFLNANYATTFPTVSSAYSLDRAKQMQVVFHHLTRTASAEKKVHQNLIQHYRNYFISLNNPTYEKGWLRRVDALDDFTYASLRAAKSERRFLLAGIFAGSVALATLVTHFIVEEHSRQIA